MNSTVNWFEIPASNFDRAVRFYGDLFQGELAIIDMGERKLALLPPGSGPEGETNPGGSILQAGDFEPSSKGSLVYLDPITGLDEALVRVESAGGKVDTPKMRIGAGYLATFIDSEGNTVGLLEWDQEEQE